MGLRVLRERRAHGVDRDGAQRHPGQVLAAGEQRGDRVEVLAVGLHRVRRGLAGTAVGEERGEPLRSRTVDTISLRGAVGHATSISWIMVIIHEMAVGSDTRREGAESLRGRIYSPTRRLAGIVETEPLGSRLRRSRIDCAGHPYRARLERRLRFAAAQIRLMHS